MRGRLGCVHPTDSFVLKAPFQLAINESADIRVPMASPRKRRAAKGGDHCHLTPQPLMAVSASGCQKLPREPSAGRHDHRDSRGERFHQNARAAGAIAGSIVGKNCYAGRQQQSLIVRCGERLFVEAHHRLGKRLELPAGNDGFRLSARNVVVGLKNEPQLARQAFLFQVAYNLRQQVIAFFTPGVAKVVTRSGPSPTDASRAAAPPC